MVATRHRQQPAQLAGSGAEDLAATNDADLAGEGAFGEIERGKQMAANFIGHYQAGSKDPCSDRAFDRPAVASYSKNGSEPSACLGVR